MAMVLVGILIFIFTIGGADRLAGWLLPMLPPLLGESLIIGGLLLLLALVLRPISMLTQMLLRDAFKGVFIVGRYLIQTIGFMCTSLVDMLRIVWRGMRGRNA